MQLLADLKRKFKLHGNYDMTVGDYKIKNMIFKIIKFLKLRTCAISLNV